MRVLPVYSAVLGDGTQSDDEYVAPLQTSHLFWDCLLNGPGVPTPIEIHALIDSSAHTVLIDQQLADCLGLRRHKLHTPLNVNLAMGGGG